MPSSLNLLPSIDNRALSIVSSFILPSANSIMSEFDVMAEQLPLIRQRVQWILLIGPYWLPKTFSPFSEAKSTVRAYKISDGSDLDAALKLLSRIKSPSPKLDELYLLST
ncbi:hypothetical protein H4582DRAFT_1911931 [Lactarius indigo]|nr:hypothetical protein H4582DRAFT_1911931 [Lactarius indigo]